jgi:ornithine cyclodeaminase/alanine dehydrogenase-like protein (mu-crystallin family)
MMFSAENGRLLAILPDGQIQKTRVALTHALAAKYLAREDGEVLGLFGSGWQAGAQATVLACTRNLKRIQVYSPNQEHRERFVRGMRDRVTAEIVAVVSPERAMADADIVIGATDSLTTVIYDKWVRPGMHISGVRSWSEIDPKIIERADRVVAHNRTNSIDHWCGELPSGLADRDNIGIRREVVPELADIVGGKAPGRESPDDITLFVDGDAAGGPGIGIQFAAVSYVLFNKARERGVGHELPLDWFLDREDHPYLLDEQQDEARR